MTCMNLQQSKILIGDFVDLPVADKNVFAAALYASQGANPTVIPACADVIFM